MTHLNPFVLFFYFAATAGISMFSMNPVIQIFSLAGALSFFFVRNAGKKTGMHLPLLGLALLVIMLNPLFQHNGATVLFVLNGNPITAEACIYGAVSALMLLATLYWFRSFSELMTSDKILYLFGRISPKLALLLSMAMRYIPLFGLQLKKTAQVQKAMGNFKEENAQICGKKEISKRLRHSRRGVAQAGLLRSACALFLPFYRACAPPWQVETWHFSALGHLL